MSIHIVMKIDSVIFAADLIAEFNEEFHVHA